MEEAQQLALRPPTCDIARAARIRGVVLAARPDRTESVATTRDDLADLRNEARSLVRQDVVARQSRRVRPQWSPSGTGGRHPSCPPPDGGSRRRGPTAGVACAGRTPCEEGWSFYLRAVICSVAAGTTVFRSPTTPKSASSKIGASGSLLMATMVFEVCMPARCWIAPEMPTATYSCGETVLPVCPTWKLCG